MNYESNWLNYLSNEYGLGGDLSNPQHIMNSIAENYGINPNLLDKEMFSGIPEDLLRLLNPKLSGNYRESEADPLFQDYIQQVGLLNQPWALNTNRNKSILDAYLEAGMSGISKKVESRQNMYGNMLKDWASSQVGSALRQTYI